MQRVGFRLQVQPSMMDEYVRRHEQVWPEMLDALRETGWTNYSLFLDRSDGTLFGYFETPDLAEHYWHTVLFRRASCDLLKNPLPFPSFHHNQGACCHIPSIEIIFKKCIHTSAGQVTQISRR